MLGTVPERSRDDVVKRKSLEGNVCPVARSLDIIGDWWSLLIVRDALMGKRRFGEFQRSLGVARNILAARLRALVAENILEVVPASDGSAYGEYVPTAKGKALLPVLVALGQWGREHLFEAGEACTVLVDALDRRPLDRLQIRAQDGRTVTADEVLAQVRGGNDRG
jgi:DNA-binding HxlR family transcriptional regulator